MAVNVINGKTDVSDYTIGIVAARWNSFITDKLLEGALDVLKRKGYTEEQIVAVRCSGAYEIPFTAKQLLPKVDGVITIGAVIRGETPHFDYVCQAVSKGVLQLNMESNKPLVFGVLTTDTVQQATERASAESDFGNKGTEAALALVEMLSLNDQIQKMKDLRA